MYVTMQLPYLFVLCHSHKQCTVQVAPSIACTAGKDGDPHSTEALNHTKLSLAICLVNALIYIATEMICITAIDLTVLINCNSARMCLTALQYSCHCHSHIMQFQITSQLASYYSKPFYVCIYQCITNLTYKEYRQPSPFRFKGLKICTKVLLVSSRKTCNCYSKSLNVYIRKYN